ADPSNADLGRGNIVNGDRRRRRQRRREHTRGGWNGKSQYFLGPDIDGRDEEIDGLYLQKFGGGRARSVCPDARRPLPHCLNASRYGLLSVQISHPRIAILDFGYVS